MPIKLIFHIGTPYNKLAILYTNCSGQMTKMADMLVCGKNLLISSSGLEGR